MSWFDLTRPPACYAAPRASAEPPPRVLKTEKFCTRCEELLPLTKFNARKKSRDGLQTYCKACMWRSAKESQARKAQRMKDRPPMVREAAR